MMVEGRRIPKRELKAQQLIKTDVVHSTGIPKRELKVNVVGQKLRRRIPKRELKGQ